MQIGNSQWRPGFYPDFRLSDKSPATAVQTKPAAGVTPAELKKQAPAISFPTDSPRELSEAEQNQINELKKRDAEVKAHEQAHLAAGGPYVSGGAHYEYQKGPDNRNYAVGGEVKIDVSEGNTPEATIQKMQVVKRAALAPKDPSGQDRAIAARAAQIEAQARIKLQQERSPTTAAADDKQSPANNPSAQPSTRYNPTRRSYEQTAAMTSLLPTNPPTTSINTRA
ncbi:MAG TPA: hypothetical protein ENN66_08600 [Proteobacteria bacterium]|nr:hypothetical protein [Pseudomonadota bacterium]